MNVTPAAVRAQSRNAIAALSSMCFATSQGWAVILWRIETALAPQYGMASNTQIQNEKWSAQAAQCVLLQPASCSASLDLPMRIRGTVLASCRTLRPA